MLCCFFGSHYSLLFLFFLFLSLYAIEWNGNAFASCSRLVFVDVDVYVYVHAYLCLRCFACHVCIFLLAMDHLDQKLRIRNSFIILFFFP